MHVELTLNLGSGCFGTFLGPFSLQCFWELVASLDLLYESIIDSKRDKEKEI
jgi:hypothetical protein